jgi:hypothetical protein
VNDRLFDPTAESPEDRERRATLICVHERLHLRLELVRVALRRWLVERFGANVVDLLPAVERGPCDDCGREGPRWRLGRLVLCRDCARTRRAIGAAAA